MTVLHRFHGGIHPPDCKAMSNPGALLELPLPPQCILPLSSSTNRPAAKPLVDVGAAVLGGQLLASPDDALAVAVHAPSSGTVIAIEPRPVAHASGLTAPCVVIETDGEDNHIPGEPLTDWRSTPKDTLLARIRDAGIAGLGGAGFPTATKLIAGTRTPIHTLLINGAECEPYITADDTLMQRQAREVIEGAEVLANLVGAKRIVIAVEDNKPRAIAALEQSAAAVQPVDADLEVLTIPTLYPSGGEKQLIEIVTGEQVPSGKLPADIGVICQNPGTLVAVRDAIVLGKPLTERIVTLTGEALSSPGNVRAKLGTPINWLLAQAGWQAKEGERVIHGGPLMGFTLPDLDAPITKISNCLLAPTADELPAPPPAQACIRCGLCAEVCPASLLPQQLFWYARAKDSAQLEKHRLFDCIECGACAWVCPSHIPLVQYYRAAKDTLREAREERARAEVAKARFEARQARVEQDAVEQEAKRAARRAAAQAKAKNAEEDPVQAAIARAKARRTERSVEDDPVKAAIARAAAKKAANAAVDEQDPIKAAIARAAAKKAAARQQWSPASDESSSGEEDQ